jgi:hypothetical protein
LFKVGGDRMKKSARPVEAPSGSPAGSGSVVVAAFAGLAYAKAALADLPAGGQPPEIVGTGLSPAPATPQPTAQRVGSGVLLGLAAGLLVGGALALFDVTAAPHAPVFLGCLLVGVLTGLGCALRALPTPAGTDSVRVLRFELRAPVADAHALRDRLRAAEPVGLLELGTVAARPRLAPAPLGALGRKVRTADEALGLAPHRVSETNHRE